MSLNRIIRWALPAAACLAIAAVGIGVIPKLVAPPIENDENVLVGNPCGEEMSAEELSKQLGISVDVAVGSEKVICNILDGSIGNISFEYGGNSYTLRASKQSGDFSGVNGTVIKYDKIDASKNAVLETVRGEYNYYKLTWTDGTATFILVNNNEITADNIIEIYKKFK